MPDRCILWSRSSAPTRHDFFVGALLLDHKMHLSGMVACCALRREDINALFGVLDYDFAVALDDFLTMNKAYLAGMVAS
jgi:hypothetical protein